jgi:hypothetical protein
MSDSEKERRIRADIERVFIQGMQTGWAAAVSGDYGNEMPPVAVKWEGNVPTFVLQRPSITITSGLHLPNGFRKH